MKDIAIFGAGGFGRELACIINLINQEEPTWNLIGFFDDGIEEGTEVQYGKILGGVDKLNLWDKPIAIAIALGNPKVLRTVVGIIHNRLIEFPNIIAPNVFFLDKDTIKIGKGNIIFPNSLISCNVKMGDFNMLNVYTQMGHESELGNYNVIMPNTSISGGVIVGNANLFGVKSTVLQYKKVGNEVVLSPGSVLSRSAKDGKMYLGNPAKVFM
ncbi:MAG: serine acetyltransferase [Bacteroidaceae bacterium]|nr:serine acetyltransferase [Bacteroidaceae bacterium]